MKKTFLLILTAVILVTSCLTVSAAEAFVPARPLGYNNDEVDHLGTLSNATMEKLLKGEDGKYSIANMGTNIALNLTSSPAYTPKVDGKQPDLTAEQIADIAKTSYGVSLIGAIKLDRPISAISDEVWTQGGKEMNGVMVGAGGWTIDSYFYNYKGETKNDTTVNEAEGYIYSSMVTYNFGATKRLDYMIFAPNGNNSLPGFPIVADIYVSADGVNWTLHSYYDIAEIRTEGLYGENRAFECFSESYLGKDRYGGTSSGKYGIAFNMEGLETQYVRLAFTSGKGKTNITDYNSVFNNIYGTDNASGIRDIIIIGGDPVAEEEKAIEFVGTQNSAIVDGKYSIRMIAEIDSLAYASAGFETSVRYFASGNSTSTPTAASGIKTYSSSTAYSSILSFNGEAEETITADEGKYFVAINVTNIPVDTHLLILEVTPVATTENGTVRGESFCVVFVDGVYLTTYSLVNTAN